MSNILDGILILGKGESKIDGRTTHVNSSVDSPPVDISCKLMRIVDEYIELNWIKFIVYPITVNAEPPELGCNNSIEDYFEV